MARARAFAAVAIAAICFAACANAGQPPGVSAEAPDSLAFDAPGTDSATGEAGEPAAGATSDDAGAAEPSRATVDDEVAEQSDPDLSREPAAEPAASQPPQAQASGSACVVDEVDSPAAALRVLAVVAEADEEAAAALNAAADAMNAGHAEPAAVVAAVAALSESRVVLAELAPECGAVLERALRAVNGLGDAAPAGGGADSEQTTVATVLQNQHGLTAEEAGCVADRLTTPVDVAPDEIELLAAIAECA